MICPTTLVLVAQVVAQSGLRHYYRPLRQKAVATGCATAFCRIARPVAQWRRNTLMAPLLLIVVGGTKNVWPWAPLYPARPFMRTFFARGE
jgi:hypothetical protein